MTDHQSLYKSTEIGSNEALIEQRRRRLLDEQKSRRQANADAQRQRSQDILDDLQQDASSTTTDADAEATTTATTATEEHQPLDDDSFTKQQQHSNQRPKNKNKNKHHRSSSSKYKNHLQLSEWLRDRPHDLDTKWIMVACPQGRRCLVVAHHGRTTVYGKNGGFIRHFRSALPGGGAVGASSQPDDVTILDCVQSPATDAAGLWVLDVLAYGQHDFTDGECEFRFYWLRNCCELPGAEATAAAESGTEIENRMRPALRADCADTDAVNAMLAQYPLYRSDGGLPATDGFLFYHRESAYMHGQTPLVGWLCPWMLAEVLGWPAQRLHPEWLAHRPEGAADAREFMVQFDAELKKRKRRTHGPGGWRKARDVAMDEEDADDDERNATSTADTMESEQCLEMTGECIDDVYYKECE